MDVKKNVTLLNVIGMNLVLFNHLYLGLFNDIAFVYLLQSDAYFNIPVEEASRLVGDIIFWTNPFGLCKFYLYITFFIIVCDFCIGYVHDIFGRRFTIFIGFIIYSISIGA